MKIKRVIVIITLIFWPISLLLANTPSNFISYLLPLILILLSFYLYKKNKNLYWLPIVFIPFLSFKLAIFPFAFLSTMSLFNKKARKIIPIIIALVIFGIFFKAFWGQTIFKADYEARQEVIRNTYLYPSVLLARTFQNKGRIFINKFANNFVSLIDPNNYFFSFHPREIPLDNQNLAKYPFLALPFLILGLLAFRKNVFFPFVTSVFLASLFSLLLLTNFDRNDFILFAPMSFIIVSGINTFDKKYSKAKAAFYLFFLFFSLFELIRILVIYKL